MDPPKLRVNDESISDPANAHRRSQVSPSNQQQQQYFDPSAGNHSSPPEDFLPNYSPSQDLPPNEAPEFEPTVEQRLNLRLRNGLPCYVGTEWRIAQPHILQNILTTDEILILLEEYQSNGRLEEGEDLEALCEKVRGDGHTSCIVVLAMLILVDRGFTIGQMMRYNVCDDNLPLVRNTNENPVLYFRGQAGESWQRLRCFEDYGIWGVQTKLDICKWQWYLKTPFMEVVGPEFQACEERFGPDVILPWSSKSKDGEVMRHDRTDGFGGYSAVYKRHIYDEFHGFHEILREVGLDGGRGFFALKAQNIPSVDEQAMIPTNLFENERRQLKRFNGIANNHLVTLLAAYEQEDTNKNFFIFPWAECDLAKYWETKQPDSPEDIRWISKQLNGLVGALDEIHNPTHDSSTLGPEGPRVFGRHGDLKPDNILWYTPYNKDPRGILVISDMGFTAVNSELSRSKQTNGKPRTPGYRPPELDIEGEKVTREYDVWSLGCVFLEMMTWILGGNLLNQEFKNKRKTNEKGVKTSIFFDIVNDQPIVKEEVTKWIGGLRMHEKSTKFIHDVLDVVQQHMIIPHASGRSKVQDLKGIFHNINEMCGEEESYYTTPYMAQSE